MSWRSRWASTIAVTLVVSGCASPFDAEGEDILTRRVAEAIDHELESVPPDERLQQTTQPPGEVEADLADRMDELDAVGAQLPFPEHKLDLGPDLTGAEQKEVTVSLQSTIVSAVENNLDIQTARLQPAIREADVVAAEAVFDAVFVANVNLNSQDQPIPNVSLGGMPFGSTAQVTETYRFDTGIRKRLTSGGLVNISTDLTRFENNSPGIEINPSPSYTSAIRLGIAQPLLRGFGTSVNTAEIRLARNLERSSVEDLRSELLTLLEDTESAYWRLVFAWQDLAIFEWLLEVGIQVRDVMERRREFDTRQAEFSDAVARVEERKSNVIRARRAIRAASDQLKVFINDAELTVGSEALLVPADIMIESPIRYSLREAILIGIEGRPEIHQAILRIDDASIRQELADNQRLPLLNLSAEMAWFGLDDDTGQSYQALFDNDFISWVLGANFEYAIGNREGEAGFRQARLRRSGAVIGYQQAVQLVVFDIKNALRDCITNYELIQAFRSSRIAAAENLRALLVEEETLAGLTPEFLNLKFQRQERLAIAQRDEVDALVNYNNALAALYRSMGISLSMNRIELKIEEQESK